jgi:hypothetical protein
MSLNEIISRLLKSLTGSASEVVWRYRKSQRDVVFVNLLSLKIDDGTDILPFDKHQGFPLERFFPLLRNLLALTTTRRGNLEIGAIFLLHHQDL